MNRFRLALADALGIARHTLAHLDQMHMERAAYRFLLDLQDAASSRSGDYMRPDSIQLADGAAFAGPGEYVDLAVGGEPAGKWRVEGDGVTLTRVDGWRLAR